LVFIAIWVIGFPFLIFYQLYRQRKNLSDQKVVLSYGLFFVGLTDKAFFWEVVITNIRKVVFVLCSTLLGGMDPLYKV
jgi:hypothetical protein